MSSYDGWSNKKCYEVYNLDKRVDGRASRVLVGIAHGVASYGRFVSFGTLAAVVAFALTPMLAHGQENAVTTPEAAVVEVQEEALQEARLLV